MIDRERFANMTLWFLDQAPFEKAFREGSPIVRKALELRRVVWKGCFMESRSRSFAKAISWRVTGTIDTMVISLIVTGSIKLAAAIGFTEVATKSLLYYFHERAWLKIPYGRLMSPHSSSQAEETSSPAEAGRT